MAVRRQPRRRVTAVAGAASAAERKVLYWYDPMVPTQRFDKPGKSPFMDMQLVPRYADEAGSDTGRRWPCRRRPCSRSACEWPRPSCACCSRRWTSVGTVGLNERDVSIVQARANGFVERVYARAPGDVIAAGAPLAEVLHPDWLAAQREYLAVRATGDDGAGAGGPRAAGAAGHAGGPGRARGVDRAAAGGDDDRGALGRADRRADGAPGHDGVRRHDAGAHQRPGHRVGRGGRARGAWPPRWPRASAPSCGWPPFPATCCAARWPPCCPRPAATPARCACVSRCPTRASGCGRHVRPGAAARAGRGAEVVTVPGEAVIRTGRRALVYVVDAPGRYRPVEVELGRRSTAGSWPCSRAWRPGSRWWPRGSS
jgi:Cu(I)/Ag(I) efflux system membrane fusion protein